MPSELLRSMKELAEDVPADNALIKQLFFPRLPPQVKTILAPMVEKSPVDVIASSANKVMDYTKRLLPRLFPSHRLKSLRSLLRLGT